MTIDGKQRAARGAHPPRHGRRRRRAPSSARCTASRRGSTTSTSSSPARSRRRRSGRCAPAQALGLSRGPPYGNFEEMASREARAEGRHRGRRDRDAESHALPGRASAFLRRGIHVICDKPLTSTLRDAKKLAALVERGDAVFALTHNYTGYPMVRQAREMVRARRARRDPPRPGRIRAGLARRADSSSRGRSRPRGAPIPNASGAGGAIGDIGTHAYNLAGFVTGLEAEALAADLHTFVPGRKLDDNAHVLLRYEGGAKGMLWASQVARRQRERPQAARVRHARRARMGAGRPEPSRVVEARRAAPAFDALGARGRARGCARDEDSVGPPGGLPRGVRDDLLRGGGRDQREEIRRAARRRGSLSHRARRRPRRGIRQVVRRVVAARRRLGQALGRRCTASANPHQK